jgi:glutamine amidotransferase
LLDVAIIDYGMGNVRSVRNAVEYCGYDAAITSDPALIADAHHLILPGVGAFGDAMKKLRDLNLIETLNREVRDKGKPLLGVCLGMQVLARSSTEHAANGEPYRGLGWFEADVIRLEVNGELKIPHMGWNSLSKLRDHPVLAGVRDKDLNFYFVHSYWTKCDDPADVSAIVHYDQAITAIIARDNIVATQFHPEKSQDSGIDLLSNFLKWSP